MLVDLGTVKPGSTIRIPFSSFDKDDGSSITMTNFAVADILIYKDGGTTERASTSGFTATTDFDAKTGKHLIVIDLSDNTTSGFWNAGSEYLVAIDSVTVDAVTVGGWVARFRIGYPSAMLDTTIATLSSQTSFTLTTGPAEDDALNGRVVIIHDIASAVQCGTGLVADYTGSTKTVTLAAGVTFTASAGDNISIMDLAPLQPATLGRTLVVDASGLADANAVKVGPTGSGTAQTAGDLKASITTVGNFVDTEIADIQARLPAALVGGRIDASVGAMAANVLTATAINADAITAAKIADGAIDRATFADDTGHKSIRSNTAQAGSGTSITLDASASAVTDFYKNALIILTGGTGAGQARFCTAYNGTTKVATVSAWATNPDNTSTFAVMGFDAIVGATAPTAAQVATAVWQDLLAGSDFATATSIGKLLKDDIDAAISSRASQTSLDTVDDYVDTEVAAIKAKTDQLTFTNANKVDAAFNAAADLPQAAADKVWSTAARILTAGTNIVLAKGTGVTGLNDLDAAGVRGAVGLASANLDTQLTAIDDFIDTEVAAIKAKTDQLVFTVANQVDVNVLDWKSATAPAMTGDAFARLGAPVAASISADIAAIDADTGTTIPAALLAIDDFVDDLELRLTAAIATVMAAHSLAVGRLAVGAGSTTTTVKFSTVNGSAPSSVNDFYNGRTLVFTSGALLLQAVSITDYDGATTTATISASTSSAVNGVTGVIV